MASKVRSAAAAGAAAGRKRQATFELPHVIEDAVELALQGLAIPTDAVAPPPPPPPSQPASSLGARPSSLATTGPSASESSLIQQVSHTYLELLTQGFSRQRIEKALDALPLRTVDVGPALDWLLLNLDRSELPKHYADQTRVRGTAELVHKAGVQPWSGISANGTAAPDARAAEAAAAAEAATRLKEEQRQEEEEEEDHRARRDEEEREKAARRAWILQYAEGSDSDSEASETEGRSPSSSNASTVIEDWEVWGDPREIERRRAERARTSLPLEDRLGLIAKELAAAKENASKAKASGDKAGQRAVGQLIGQLKREMAELRVTEDQLPAVVDIHHKVGALNAADESEGTVGAEQAEKREKDGSNDGDGVEFDLFGGAPAAEEFSSSAPLSRDARKKRAAALAAAAGVHAWGFETAGGAKKKAAKGGSKPASHTQPDVFQPKAVLQQACQRYGWSAPKYERLPPGGERVPGGIRYRVILESPHASRSSGNGRTTAILKKGEASQGSKTGATKRTAHGGGVTAGDTMRSFGLPDSEDGWERIEDAQNAAATLALLALKCSEDGVWKTLAPPFAELYLMLESEGLGERGPEAEESEDDVASRESFARALVSRKLEEEEKRSLLDGLGRNASESTRFGGTKEEASWARSVTESLQRQLQTAGTRATAAREVGATLLAAQNSWRSSKDGKRWAAQRDALPASALREPVCRALSANVVVISGETGSGKTTQIPQFILENEIDIGNGGQCSIICTQPRRIAAISVAERVAAERGEPMPGSRGSAVGYSVRLDTRTSSDTRLLFCTTGVLLRRLASDPALASVSHVIVDEVHERTLQGDFLIALLRDLVAARRSAGVPLKVVLMSATLDANLLAEYFGGGCPTLSVKGRTFPVQHFFLEDVYEETGYLLASDSPVALRSGAWARRKRVEKAAVGGKHRDVVRAAWGDEENDDVALNPNYDENDYEGYSSSTKRNLARVDEDRIDFDMIEELIGHIHDDQDEGAILVFLPGMGEIASLLRRLQASRRFATCWTIPLHSSVSPADQRKAFRHPPQGTRKVVLATNIAETSLTIDDVVYVIDSGKLKERRHDPARGMSLLVEDWVSTASAAQRRGRAGRVREGVCYALYTKPRYERRMKPFQAPEMQRVPLEELVLQVRMLGVAPRASQFLARALQPPPAAAVEGAVRVLREVGALTETEALTPLGHHLAQLPLDVRLGKLLLVASCLGCLSPALSIAACLAHKSPFLSSLQQQSGADAARGALAASSSGTIAAGQQSDHLVMAAALGGWLDARTRGGVGAGGKFARRHSLSEQVLETLEEMRGQFAAMLADIGFLTRRSMGGHQTGVTRPRKSTTARSVDGHSWYDSSSLPANRYATHPAVLKAALLAALWPNIAVMDDQPGQSSAAKDESTTGSWHDGSGAVALHPSSLCASLSPQAFHRPFVAYLEKVRTSRVFLRDCTVVSPASILLFGGQLDVDHAAGRVTVDGWIRIRASARTAALARQMRQGLDALLKRKVSVPEEDLRDGGGGALIEAIVKALDWEDAVAGWDR